MADDGADPDGGSDNGDDLDFDTATWSPAEQRYGLFYLMVIRQLQGLEPEKLEKPAEIAHLKFHESRLLNHSLPEGRKTRRERHHPEASDEDSDEVSEGEPLEDSEAAPWPGKKASWWRVHTSLGEDLVIREGLSLFSAELRRMPPGEALQQAGAARMLSTGRAAGCIRLPVKPRGWVTADACRAGGPRYLVSSSAPRWRVVHSATEKKGAGEVIIRADAALDSAEVTKVYYGDIVEQAGPSELRGEKGIVRMPVASVMDANGTVRRSDGEADNSHWKNRDASSSKVLGWVTVDASSAGGPVFFKPLDDADNKRRRRRPGWS